MADDTKKFWELFRAVSTENDQGTPGGIGWYENNDSGIIKYFSNDPPNDLTEWSYMDPGYFSVTNAQDAIAKSDRTKLETYFTNVIDQVSFNTTDYNRLRKLFIDLFATNRSLATISTQLTDPHSLSNSDLDELFRSFGYNYSTQLRGFDENPLEQKIQFFLDLVNLYKVKGTPQSLVDVLQYYGVTELDIYEFFLKLKDTQSNLIFEGKAVAGTSLNPGDLELPYVSLTGNDPHWLYTKQQILNLNQSLDINLPSKTPYLGIQPIVDLDGPEMSILVRSVQDQYGYYESTGTLPIANAEITFTGETVSLLELYLSTIYMFNKLFTVGAEAPSYFCYDGTNTEAVEIIAEYKEITGAKPTSRQDIQDRISLYNDTFSRLTPTNFLVDRDTAGDVLTVINPSLKTSLDGAGDQLDVLYSLLKDLSLWVRANIGYGFVNFGFILFGLNEFFRDLKPVIDFFKPYRARLLLLESLQVRNRLFNSIIVEDNMSVGIDLDFHDFLTGDSKPCCAGDMPIDATSDSTAIIVCEKGEQPICSRNFVSGVPTTQVWRDLWAKETDYIINDVVPDSLSNYYICIQSHNSSVGTKPPTGVDSSLYWTLLSQIDCANSLEVISYHSRDTYDCDSYFDIGAVTDIPQDIEIGIEQTFYDHLRCPPADGTCSVVTSEVLSSAYGEFHTQNIPINSSSVLVSFSESLLDDNYAIGVSIRKDVGPANIYDFIIEYKTSSGFVVLLNGVVDDSDYYIDWYVNDSTANNNWGVDPLTIGTVTKTIMLPQPCDSTSPYAVSISLSNTTDLIPHIYSYSIIEKTSTYFTVQFSAPIDNDNYKLEWSYCTGAVSGNYQLPSGNSSVTVPIDPLDHDGYPLLLSFATNDSTAAPNIYDHIVTSKTSTDFTVNFSSIIDSDNYYISWVIPDITSPSLDQIEYYQSGGFRNFDDEGSFDCTHGFDLVEITVENVLAYILLESGYFLLQEEGGRLKL